MGGHSETGLLRLAAMAIIVALTAACSPPESFNAGDPASREYFETLTLRCALNDETVCPHLGDGTGSSPTVVQIQPTAGASNLKLWLEADKFSQGDGTNVLSWPDSSTSGFNADQGTGVEQPTYQVNGINGLPSVRFDDTATPGNNLILGPNYLFSVNDGITIVAVLSSTTEDSSDDYVLDFGGANSVGYGVAFSANADGAADNLRMYSSAGHGGQTVTGAIQVPPGNGIIIVARLKFSPAADKHTSVYLNGTLTLTETAHTLTQLTANEIGEANTRGSNVGPVTIGGQSKINSQAGRFFKGDMSLMLWFNRALTDAERQGYECFASLKYGIAVPQNCI